MLANQRTIDKQGKFDGIGLHTGVVSSMIFCPAPAGYGIKFVRTDLEGSPEVHAHIDNVIDIRRGTIIKQGDAVIHTVEHVLSAIAGLQIDNIKIELTAEEPPAGDGSPLPFVEVLESCGIVTQNAPKYYLEIDKTMTYHDKERKIDIVVVPSDRFRITYMIDYPDPVLGTQYTTMYDLEDEFKSEYAPARTFCMVSEIEQLLAANLIKGGRIDNAVVFVDKLPSQEKIDEICKRLGIPPGLKVSESGFFANVKTRFPNEPVRHKAVDLIGDLALLGVPIKGHILAARAGHASHIEVVKMLYKDLSQKKMQAKYQTSQSDDFVFDINAIHNILPHRYPFLMVDRIVELRPGEWVSGIKNVTIGEPFFEGHFPGRPIMPGVLIVEAMGQVGGILLLNTAAKPEEKLVYFTGLDKVKFRKPVVPGDQLSIKVEMIKYRRGLCKMKGHGFVGGKLVAEADMTAVVVDR